MANRVVRALLALLLTWAAGAQAQPSAGVIRVVADDNYPPFVFVGADGRPRGYLVDEWALWQRKTGIRVEWTLTRWADAQRRLLDGQAEVIELIFQTPGRRALYDFTPGYSRLTASIYADAAIAGIDDVDELRGFAVGVERGDACAERLRRDGVTSLREFARYRDVIAAAARHDIRIFCMDRYPANYYLYRAGLQRRFNRAFDYYTADVRRGVRKGDADTLALVERGMALITDDERTALRRKWMGRPLDLGRYAGLFGYALLAVTLAGLALLGWVYSLRRGVERRTRQVDYLTRHESVTGLPNRHALLDRIDHAIARRPGTTLALLLLNLDSFQQVNEGYGHRVGDQLLRDVAVRLGECLPQADTVATLGGDQFAVLLEGGADAAIVAARTLLRAMEPPFLPMGHELVVQATVGIALHPADGDEAGTLLRNAAAAMQRARQGGGNRFGFYRTELTVRANHVLQLGTALRRAIERGEFFLLYQPQVHIATGRVAGVEALVRWRNGDAVVPPAEFVPYAEDSGLIEAIGQWVLEAACRQLADWLAAGLPPVRMAVNLSPRQLASPDIVARVGAVLEATGIPPRMLELEITEGVVLQHGPEVAGILRALRELGVSLAIDDFGTGHSSLSYLRHLPAQLMKIDQSFMAGVPEDNEAVEVVAAIVAMAHTLGRQVLAEGVETAGQWEFLQIVGCDYSQGWFHGHPLPADEVAEKLRQLVR